MPTDFDNAELTQLFNTVTPDVLNNVGRRDARRLRFPKALEQLFLRYYDGRFRSWFRAGAVMASALAALTLVFFWRGAPNNAGLLYQREVLAITLGMLLSGALVFGLTFSAVRLERLQWLMYPSMLLRL